MITIYDLLIIVVFILFFMSLKSSMDGVVFNDRTKIKRINYAISELKSFHLYLIHIILYLGRSDMA